MVTFDTKVSNTETLKKAERDWLIERYFAEFDEYVRLFNADASEKKQDAALELSDSRIIEYYGRLPRMTLSRCPFTGEPLVRAFDPWGIDGFWWQREKIRDTDEPAAPPHFHLLQGAVSLNGLPPKGGRHEALVGPEVPFVIPRIMSRQGMVAVISSIAMDNGYTAYPVAYYSLTKPEPGCLTQGWREDSYSYVDSDGRGSWRIDAHPWDFELKGWVQSGRVKWINPDDPLFLVNEGSWEEFPYRDLPGDRQRQTIVEDKLYLSPPPNDEKFEPFE